jgi:hypothetical protein
MPIVLRGTDHKPHRIDKACGVEIIDNAGAIAVIIIQSRDGAVQILTPGSASFALYCAQVKGAASDVVVHEDYVSTK